MNLFYLDTDHDTNAQYHVDKHVVKMILEAAEMLSMAHIVARSVGFYPDKLPTDEYREAVLYKSTFKDKAPEDRDIPYVGRDAHLNHPSTVWVRSSSENYYWTYCYMHSLEMERRYRNPNGVPEHKAYMLTRTKLDDVPVVLARIPMTPFALAMGSMREAYPEYINDADPIGSYRRFYMADKSTFASWKYREPPPWWDQEWASAHSLRD